LIENPSDKTEIVHPKEFVIGKKDAGVEGEEIAELVAF
jgi:hypothetical protein